MNFKTGKCKLKKNVSKKINQLNFGRGKKFEYQYITGNRVRIFKKGIQLIMSNEKFNNNFEIIESIKW